MSRLAVPVVEFLAAGVCLLWAVVAALSWLFHDRSIFGRYSPDVAAQQTHLAIALTAVLVLNLAAIAAFEVRRTPYGWWLLTGVQAANFIVCGVFLLLHPSLDDLSRVVVTTIGAAGAAAAILLVAARSVVQPASR